MAGAGLAALRTAKALLPGAPWRDRAPAGRIGRVGAERALLVAAHDPFRVQVTQYAIDCRLRTLPQLFHSQVAGLKVDLNGSAAALQCVDFCLVANLEAMGDERRFEPGTIQFRHIQVFRHFGDVDRDLRYAQRNQQLTAIGKSQQRAFGFGLSSGGSLQLFV